MLKKLPLYFAIISFVFTSCKDYDNDIKDLQDRVEHLESVVSQLDAAYQSGKMVSSVQTSPDQKWFNVSFTDGSSVNIKNDVDGAFPILKIDNEGFWTASYDNEAHYTRITDIVGDPIMASGQRGKLTKVTINEGQYFIETYFPYSPNETIDTIPTPLSYKSSTTLSSIVEDKQTGAIILTLNDGTEFMFNLDVSYPTSIIVLNESVKINALSDTEFTFRINPSDAYIDFTVEGPLKTIELDIVTESSRASTSYVTKPIGYKLGTVRCDKTPDGKIKPGQYIATISSLNNNQNILERVCLVITTQNGKGEVIQISSNPFYVINGEGTDIASVSINGVEGTRSGNTFNVILPPNTNLKELTPSFIGNCTSIEADAQPISRGYSKTFDFSNPITFTAKGPDGETEEYTVAISYSNLPTVYVDNTISLIVSKDKWIPDNSIKIFNAGEFNNSYTASMKGRGNTTWKQPKKPYSIKLDSKAEVLGMPKHKRWCLIANWQDRTNLRNDVSFEIARCLDGLEWTPQGKFVDLVLNGMYWGNYYLCEQIKVDKNRLDIDEIEPTDIAGSNLTGGYLLEFDSYYDEEFKFRSELLNMPVNFKSPDEDIPQEQFDYIQNYINTIESKLIEHHDFAEIENLIDINSYIDWWILQELTQNLEPNHPKSSFMYKKREGKLYAGPAWDFDWKTFTQNNDWLIKDAIWYKYLFSYPEFVNEVKTRWIHHKNKLQNISTYIDQIASLTRASSIIDCERWPINSASLNGDELMKLPQSVDKLKQMYLARLDWMNINIPLLEPNELTSESDTATTTK